MVYISWLVHCVLLLLTVAFFTLFERNVIGLFHLRFGPNKVSFVGLIQPLLDAFNLLTNQPIVPLRSNNLAYSASPVVALVLSWSIWLTLPQTYFVFNFSYSFVIFFLAGSVIVFPVLFSGWSSNSKYSLIGSLRSVAQSISYESVFSTLIIIVIIFIIGYNINSTNTISSIIFLFLIPVWIICVLAETHRAPFDFSESESELVSGFNTEYSGVNFALLFLSEYGVLLYSCYLMTYIFLGLLVFNVIIAVTLTLCFSFFFIWVRITFCRFRYDSLMYISWKQLLPCVLSLFVIIMFV